MIKKKPIFFLSENLECYFKDFFKNKNIVFLLPVKFVGQ